MAGRTISASYAGGITLAAGDNPLTVTATGTVANTNAAALLTTGTADWVIGNAGTIAAGGTGAASVGIQMKGTAGSAGGTISNAATGVISGGQFGIYTVQAGTLSNAGTVSAAGATTVSGSATVATSVAVLFGTGQVENSGGISGSKYGVYIIGAGTVANTGTIAGAGDSGVVLNGGGLLSNSGTAAAISGGRLGAYLFGTGTVVNSGSIAGTGTIGDGVLMMAGGVFENQAGGRVTGTRIGLRATGTIASTLSNAGAVSGSTYGMLVLSTALAVTNAAGGTITASTSTIGAGIGASLGGSVGNAGSISGRFGVLVVGGVGTATNSGVIRATGKFVGQAAEGVGAGIQLQSGGTITNQAGGTISGNWIGAQVGSFNAANPNGGAVINAGTILANDPGVSGAAVWFKGNGRIENASTGLIGDGPYGIVTYNTMTITNAGTIAGGKAVLAKGATSVDNMATGAIGGGTNGIVGEAALTVGNAGRISGTNAAGIVAGNRVVTKGYGVQALGQANVSNAAGGTIVGGTGGVVGYGALTVTNAGSISAADDFEVKSGVTAAIRGSGISARGPARISNEATGSIGGASYGISAFDTVTIANRGLISGSQFAVFTSAEGKGSRIIVYPGASFSGTVLGDKAGAATPSGVLELAGGASAGTIVGFGTSFQSFGRVEVDAGATWSLGGTVASGQTVVLGGAGAALTLADPAAMGGVITGFDATTQLVLGGIADVSGSSLGLNNVLSVTRASGGTIALRFDPAQSFPAGSFGFVAGAGGTTLSAPCFALGTRIATPGGEVAVEALSAGMRVLRAQGGVAEVVWVGHRRVDCRAHPRPAEVWPVRVAAGAFGRGVPCRDLWLSPDHAVYAGGVLIPVRHLVNGRTVRQERVDSVTYFHVELAAHDVLLAEGLACESYLDTGNRAAFANGGGAMMLHADFARRAWAEGACAPLVEGGEAVAAVRARLLARAGALGHRRGPDAGVRVLAAGRVLPFGAGRWQAVAVPEGVSAVAIASRSWVPAEMDGSADARRLGVAVGRVMLDGLPVRPGDARFGAGWHAPEGDWRWSDGMGWLHLRGARQLRFEVAASGVYWLGEAA